MEVAVAKPTARDLMTPKVLAAHADWSLERLAEFLIENNISGAPVLSDSGFLLVGAVSMSDLVRYESLPQREPQHHRGSSFYMESTEMHYAEEELASFQLSDPSRATVRDIMTPVIFSVKEETPLLEVARTMVHGRIHRVFVTRDGRLVGVISALDVLRAVVEKRV